MKKITFILLVILNSSFGQNGLNLDGIDDHVQTTYPGISGTSARSIEAWIKTTANCNPTDDGIQQIITDWGTFVTGGRFTFNVLWSNAIRIEIGGSGISGTIPVNDGLWHHVAVVYNPLLVAPYRLYVDGELDVEGTLPATNTVLGTDMRIGKRVDDARFFDGTIDEVRVWNYALTQDEIIAHMNSEFCVVPDALVAYYKFNQGIAGGANPGELTLFDLGAGGYDGTLNFFSLDGPASNWVTGVDLINEITVDLSANACISYTVPSGDETYITSGIYNDTLVSIGGCDSILIIDLTIGSFSSTMTVNECNEYTVPSGDETYYVSGIYMDTLSSIEGCDSILTIDVTLGYHTYSNIYVTACDEYTVPSGLMTYTESGTYEDVIENASGCDSTITIELTILHSSSAELYEEACYSYTAPSGTIYSISGDYTDIIPNEAGCDSVITIHLIIHNDTYSEITVEACDSYTSPSGENTYTEAGVYTDIITNESGCDSIITINLTFTMINVNVINEDPSLSAELDGATYQWIDCANDYMPIAGETDRSFTPLENGNYAVIITEDGCSDTSACETILTVGLAQEAPALIQLYPNPLQDQLYILLNEPSNECELFLFSLDGKELLHSLMIGSELNGINLSSFENGTYILLIKVDNQIESFRITKS